jgi:hypothetical protein
MFWFTGCLYEDFLEHIEKDLCKFALKEGNLLDEKVGVNGDTNSSGLKSEPNSFFTEIKDHLLRVGDPFLVKAFENYLPFKQVRQDVKQKDVVKRKEWLYAK